MTTETLYRLADELSDKGERAASLAIGAVACLADKRGELISELVMIAMEKSGTKRLARLRDLANSNEMEENLSFARVLLGRT